MRPGCSWGSFRFAGASSRIQSTRRDSGDSEALAEAEALLNLTTSLLRSSPSTLQILTDARKYTGGIRWQCGVIGAVAYTHRVSLRVLSRLAVGGKKQVEFAKEVAERAASTKAKDDCLKF